MQQDGPLWELALLPCLELPTGIGFFGDFEVLREDGFDRQLVEDHVADRARTDRAGLLVGLLGVVDVGAKGGVWDAVDLVGFHALEISVLGDRVERQWFEGDFVAL